MLWLISYGQREIPRNVPYGLEIGLSAESDEPIQQANKWKFIIYTETCISSEVYQAGL